MKLNDCAGLNSGLMTKRKEASSKQMMAIPHMYKLLTIKSLTNYGIDKSEIQDFISIEEIKDCYITKQSDVVVRLTSPYYAYEITKDEEGYLIPLHFIVIHCDQNKLLPGYLVALLSQKETMTKALRSSGTSVLNLLNLKFYRDFEVQLPDLKTQETVASMHKAMMKQEILLEKRLELKKKLNEAIKDKILEEIN